MKAFSAAYYVKHNKGRAAVIVFMLIFTTLMFIAGNFVDSIDWYWDSAKEYSDKMALVSAISNDEDFKDYYSFIDDIKKDEKLTCLERSALGFSGFPWKCTLGWQMGSVSYVFNSAEDLKTAFKRLGIECDLSDVGNNSLILGSAYAKNIGYKKGDVVDGKDISLDGSNFTIDAIIDDDSFVAFYVFENNDNLCRAYITSDELEGKALYDYIQNIKGDRKVQIEPPLKEGLEKELGPFKAMFVLGCVLLSVILAVTCNSVITGQYIKRTYEFGVYRALGISKARIYRKCAAEILFMDMVAILIGGGITFLTVFLLNELLYLPNGQYLPYYSEIGLECFLLSNILVVLPMILLKGRQMSKADVTEF